MSGHRIAITVSGHEVQTLRDILPDRPGLTVLFVAKTPALKSVAAGHYFRGRQGTMFWKLLSDYGLLSPTTAFEDDSMLAHGYGLTDAIKVPKEFGDEPSDAEYLESMPRILELIRAHRPKVVVFVYKRVLDRLLALHFARREKSRYGFNPELEPLLGSRAFVFPMPGTPCTKQVGQAAMRELASALGVDSSPPRQKT